MANETIERTGLPDFPETKPPHAVDREVASEGCVGDVGNLKLIVYRVGFQVQRELRNDFEPWLRYYKAKVETADWGKRVAQFSYRLINGNFVEDYQEDLQMSEQGGQELEEIGGLLFDKRGALQTRWLNGQEAGTKAFGPEISTTGVKIAVLSCTDSPKGDFLIVDQPFRHRGVASWALQTLFHMLHEEGVKFILTRPSVPLISSNLQGSSAEAQLLRRNLAFVRKAGFRRVGTSPIFGYFLQDDAHPSRSLPAEADVDPA
ncbi:uncharacterized protein LAESUDRAFT_725828 [Laetiporus sulphureus 93-53]|uniref:N-acetyltransferase domain-containing protein n=1 Tax=Laetiporus sulphureus 93-53 TaxID=1314785 RepID=A0A165ECQ8_9APHY|nr:uncharacterized protein LAESUDRAFT_725828 [Laetiporus sulphureus 93-53]KZT06743.1 hypothetical protein LAESUDRAFT_725828 [Laetiporus sulphureus 93-53]